MHLTEEVKTLRDIKNLRWNKVNKDSNRFIKNSDDNNKDYIFIHTAEKCAFYKSLEQKQKPKKPHFENTTV